MEFRGDLIVADTHRHAINTTLVGDADELISCRFVGCCDSHARQDRAGGVNHGAREHRVLRERRDREQKEYADQNYPPGQTPNHEISFLQLRTEAPCTHRAAVVYVGRTRNYSLTMG